MKFFFDQALREHPIITLVGMCKNSGKTTALKRLLWEAEKLGRKVGLLSTGLDGEFYDEFTGREKPLIEPAVGSIFATTEEGWQRCRSFCRLIKRTDYQTGLGKVFLGEVLGRGAVELSGPVPVSESFQLARRLRSEYRRDTVIIDGSINRHAIAGEDFDAGLFLATGAAFGDMEKVLEQTKYQAKLMTLEAIQEKIRVVLDDYPVESVLFSGRGGEVIQCSSERSLLEEELEKSFAGPEGWIYVPGAVHEECVEMLIRIGMRGVLIAHDASRIYLSELMWYRWREHGGLLYVRYPIHLLGLICNPYHPRGESFEPEIFLHRMREEVSVPVHDVVWESRKDIVHG